MPIKIERQRLLPPVVLLAGIPIAWALAYRQEGVLILTVIALAALMVALESDDKTRKDAGSIAIGFGAITIAFIMWFASADTSYLAWFAIGAAITVSLIHPSREPIAVVLLSAAAVIIFVATCLNIASAAYALFVFGGMDVVMTLFKRSGQEGLVEIVGGYLTRKKKWAGKLFLAASLLLIGLGDAQNHFLVQVVATTDFAPIWDLSQLLLVPAVTIPAAVVIFLDTVKFLKETK